MIPLPDNEQELARHRVAKGAALLTRDFGHDGWMSRIPDSFDVASPFNCPLYHVYGEFETGRDLLKEQTLYRDDEMFTVDHGFESEWYSPEAKWPDRLYEPLNAAWKELLDAHR